MPTCFSSITSKSFIVFAFPLEVLVISLATFWLAFWTHNGGFDEKEISWFSSTGKIFTCINSFFIWLIFFFALSLMWKNKIFKKRYLIENKEYIHKMKKFTSDTLNELFNESILDNQVKWEYLKYNIGKDTIDFSKKPTK